MIFEKAIMYTFIVMLDKADETICFFQTHAQEIFLESLPTIQVWEVEDVSFLLTSIPRLQKITSMTYLGKGKGKFKRLKIKEGGIFKFTECNFEKYESPKLRWKLYIFIRKSVHKRLDEKALGHFWSFICHLLSSNDKSTKQ